MEVNYTDKEYALALTEAKLHGYKKIFEPFMYEGDLYFCVDKGVGPGHYGLPLYIRVRGGSATLIRGFESLRITGALAMENQ